MGSSASKNKTNPSKPQQPLQTPTNNTSSQKSSTKPPINNNINTDHDQKQYDSKFLIAAYTHSIFTDINIPLDIMNIIFMYFHLIFHFDVIPKIKDCGKKNMLNHLGDQDNDDDIQAVVVTIDSECIYVGFAGNDLPTLAIPNIISMAQSNNILYGHQLTDAKYNLSVAIRPVEYGEIRNSEALKQILLEIFSGVPKDQRLHLLLSECVPFTNRQEITRFAFDELRCERFFLEPRSVLSLYSTGRTTGVVIFSDYECTEIVPVYEGYSVKSACNKINFGKRDIIDYLDKFKLNNNDNDKDENPDGMMLFFTKADIHHEIIKCIKKCDSSFDKKDFYGNIVLSGINTIYNGLGDKLRQVLSKMVDYNVKVIAPPEREYYSWIGGSILASLSTFEDMWITKDEYDKNGPSLVETKCDYKDPI